MRGTRIRGTFGEGDVVDVSDDEIVLVCGGGQRKHIRLDDLGKIEIVELQLPRPVRSFPNAHAVLGLLTADVTVPPALTAWLIAHAPKARSSDIGAHLQRPTLALCNGPLPVSTISSLLSWMRVQVEPPPSRDTEVLVLGEQLPELAPLLELMAVRAGRPLSVYSQQMYLAMLATEADPLAHSDLELVNQMGPRHAGLKFLLNVVKFNWPSQSVPPSAANVTCDLSIPDPGYLAFEGYHVGVGARPDDERRALLGYCFTDGEVPEFYLEWYRQDWGSPGSAERYDKLTRSLATFVRRDSRIHGPKPGLPVDQWTRDRAWFQSEFTPLR